MSSVLLLASLPGRLSAQLTGRPVNAIRVKWKADNRDEFILLHKSHCMDGRCPSKSSQVSPIPSDRWEQSSGILLQVEMIEDADWFKILGSGYENWGKLLSTVSFSWLPDENMAIGWRQFSWRKSIHPTAFQFSVQLST